MRSHNDAIAPAAVLARQQRQLRGAGRSPAATIQSDNGTKDRSFRWALLWAVAPLSALLGCGDPETSAAPESSETASSPGEHRISAHQAETRMMEHVPSAVKELSRRLAERVTITEGLVVVRTRQLLSLWLDGLAHDSNQFSLIALPASASWAVRCSPSGMDVVFGPWSEGVVTEGGGDVGPSSSVALTNAQLSAAQCSELAPLIALAVAEMTQHPNR